MLPWDPSLVRANGRSQADLLKPVGCGTSHVGRPVELQAVVACGMRHAAPTLRGFIAPLRGPRHANLQETWRSTINMGFDFGGRRWIMTKVQCQSR